MTKEKVIKDIFDEKINKDIILSNVLDNVLRRRNNKMKSYFRYTVFAVCFLIMITTSFIFSSKTNLKKEIFSNNVKVYFYMNSNDRVLLKDNIKIKLASYNNLMSSVPGYPIFFKFDRDKKVDYINISVKNGSILKWDSEDTFEVSELFTNCKIETDDTLYFKVNKDTVITIDGFKDKKIAFSKKILITEDKNFNYYATLK